MKVVEVLPAALPMTTLYPSFSLRGMIRPHVRRGTCDVSARDTKLRQTSRVPHEWCQIATTVAAAAGMNM